MENGNSGAKLSGSAVEGAREQVTSHNETHANAERHHHHAHAPASHHEHGHHLLQVEDLTVAFSMYDERQGFFRAKKKRVEALHGLSLSVHAGEIIAIVGASGSGKTLLADAVMGVFEPNAQVKGRIWYDGELQDATGLAALRGHGISMVPQSVRALDPLIRVGKQVEGFGASGADRESRRAKREELFARYGLDPQVADMYPHELSGGMARRVLLCTALMDDPRVIVADEPTPGLDLDLAVRAMDDFRAFANQGNGVLLITHDIELALRVADRIAVFKDGTVVEETSVENFAASTPGGLIHPFSRELWQALADLGASSEPESGQGLIPDGASLEVPEEDRDLKEEGGSAC